MSEQHPPVLNQINLVVSDLAASITFYRRLGLFVEEAALPEWAPHHATVVMPNGTRLEMDSVEFAKQWDPGWKDRQGGAGCVLFFGVHSRDEVDRIFGALNLAGYVSQKAPEDAFWGARYAIVEDPDGNPVGFMSPIDLARRYAPPPPPNTMESPRRHPRPKWDG
jgi:uncharacterized glyoxalase superfamily protein PhnB